MSENTEAVLRETIRSEVARMRAMPHGNDRRSLGMAINDMEDFRKKLVEDRKRFDAEPAP